MGMIKIPSKSKEFFDKNLSDIFKTGNLAEGEWNSKVADWTINYTGCESALAVNSNGAVFMHY